MACTSGGDTRCGVTKFPAVPGGRQPPTRLSSNYVLAEAEGGGERTEGCSDGSNFKVQNSKKFEPNREPENRSGLDWSANKLCNSGQNTLPSNPDPTFYKFMILFLYNIYVHESKHHIHLQRKLQVVTQ